MVCKSRNFSLCNTINWLFTLSSFGPNIFLSTSLSDCNEAVETSVKFDKRLRYTPYQKLIRKCCFSLTSAF
jgi:hypothetical protein